MENIKIINFSLINIDKPTGPTSFSVSEYIKEQLNLNKTSHMGTLDPKVTGVLPIALDKATRIVQVLLPAGKEYVCLMHLHNGVDEDRIKKAFERFSGEIKQMPPVRSAV